ncbi:MAG: carbohydrate kinase family protein [Ruminococcaceae bacterium]|nr:carbohydrate kinase family protein [Oscillospiraceae bacterium]
MGADKYGIAVAGTTLVDKLNTIAAYPACGELTKISAVNRAVGGCVPNVGIDLKKICPTLPVYAIGRVGADDNGVYLREVLQENGLDVSGLLTVEETTSFTEVMSIPGGQRTFFTYAGADAGLTADDIPLTGALPRILHLGYFLLLDKVDNGEGLAILKKASAAGIATSIDLVSENSDRYALVRPCLPYTDYLIINEMEAGRLAELEPTVANLPAIAQKLMEMGVRRKVIIHFREGAVCCSEQGITTAGSVDVPREEIVGTTGAGDAFCAGALYAIHEGYDDRAILDFAACTAAMALRTADATSGLCTKDEIETICQKYGRIQLCW